MYQLEQLINLNNRNHKDYQFWKCKDITEIINSQWIANYVVKEWVYLLQNRNYPKLKIHETSYPNKIFKEQVLIPR